MSECLYIFYWPQLDSPFFAHGAAITNQPALQSLLVAVRESDTLFQRPEKSVEVFDKTGETAH